MGLAPRGMGCGKIISSQHEVVRGRSDYWATVSERLTTLDNARGLEMDSPRVSIKIR